MAATEEESAYVKEYLRDPNTSEAERSRVISEYPIEADEVEEGR
jgi:hypothetical protein